MLDGYYICYSYILTIVSLNLNLGDRNLLNTSSLPNGRTSIDCCFSSLCSFSPFPPIIFESRTRRRGSRSSFSSAIPEPGEQERGLQVDPSDLRNPVCSNQVIFPIPETFSSVIYLYCSQFISLCLKFSVDFFNRNWFRRFSSNWTWLRNINVITFRRPNLDARIDCDTK